MKSQGRKYIIGILGGIGSGKTSVAAEFGKLGCKVISADRIVHDLLEKEDISSKVVARFGRAVLSRSGNVDRAKLAQIVFTDPEKLTALTKIIHPLVLARTEQMVDQFSQDQAIPAIVLDMPLLIEVGWEKHCDKLIFVDCKQDIRLERAKKMGRFDENQLKIRENFQISLDKKAALADNSIDNNSDFSALVKQVTDVFSYIMDIG